MGLNMSSLKEKLSVGRVASSSQVVPSEPLSSKSVGSMLYRGSLPRGRRPSRRWVIERAIAGGELDDIVQDVQLRVVSVDDYSPQSYWRAIDLVLDSWARHYREVHSGDEITDEITDETAETESDPGMGRVIDGWIAEGQERGLLSSRDADLVRALRYCGSERSAAEELRRPRPSIASHRQHIRSVLRSVLLVRALRYSC